MALFDFSQKSDIDQGVEEWKDSENGMLIDVRSADEYSQGHVPGSINIPLNQIASIQTKVPDKDTPLFVHCLSGARSARAVMALTKLGYTNAKNIGGFNLYHGEVEE